MAFCIARNEKLLHTLPVEMNLSTSIGRPSSSVRSSPTSPPLSLVLPWREVSDEDHEEEEEEEGEWGEQEFPCMCIEITVSPESIYPSN